MLRVQETLVCAIAFSVATLFSPIIAHAVESNSVCRSQIVVSSRTGGTISNQTTSVTHVSRDLCITNEWDAGSALNSGKLNELCRPSLRGVPAKVRGLAEYTFGKKIESREKTIVCPQMPDLVSCSARGSVYKELGPAPESATCVSLCRREALRNPTARIDCYANNQLVSAIDPAPAPIPPPFPVEVFCSLDIQPVVSGGLFERIQIAGKQTILACRDACDSTARAKLGRGNCRGTSPFLPLESLDKRYEVLPY